MRFALTALAAAIVMSLVGCDKRGRRSSSGDAREPSEPTPASVQEAPAPASAEFSESDPLATLGWLRAQYRQAIKDDAKGNLYANKSVTEKLQDFDRSLQTPRDIRWPITVSGIDRTGQVGANYIQYYSRRLAEHEHDNYYTLRVCSSIGYNEMGLFRASSEGWLRSATTGSTGVLFGRVKKVIREVGQQLDTYPGKRERYNERVTRTFVVDGEVRPPE